MAAVLTAMLAALLTAALLPASAHAKRAPQGSPGPARASVEKGPAREAVGKAPAGPTPLRVLGAFDSLLKAGDLPAARALCTGQVLRMFDFLAMTHAKMAGLVDSARSREDTLADTAAGDWAYVKLASHVVFRQPFMGQEELRSVQAVHLWRSSRGWLIAEFEELEGPQAPVRFRAGRPPADPQAAGSGGRTAPDRAAPAPEDGGPEAPGMFPISPLAPDRPGLADWMKFRLRTRNGAPLAELCVLDGYQRIRDTVSASEWILENRLPSSKDTHKRALARREAVRKAALADSMQPYLASNAYLILEDSLLRDAARKAARAGSLRDPKAMAGNIREWVTRGFRFQLGAVLFGNSREVLRNMTGDCSEAAILTAALLRASGVPSRVAMGFASAGRGVFIGHAWTEAWLGDDLGWVGVDAALGQFPAGVERIKLMHLDGASDMRIAATNLMLASLSNLDIEILEARKGTREIPLVEHPGAAGEGARFFADILKGFGEGR